MTPLKILVTGATGYVGGRLIPLLLESGYRVKAMARTVKKLASRSWANHPLIEIVSGDVFDLKSLKEAASGCFAAYYLVHSMNPQTKNYEEADRVAASNMVKAAAEADLNRIIYLGGLGDADDEKSLSKHLKSRHEVAKILRSGSVPTTFLRAAMIIGSGSASFEIMRYLVDRLPVMITPRWVHTLNQPIAIRNVLIYLKGCLAHDEVLGQTYDIGGPDVISYRDLFDIYAEEAGIPKRKIIPVPILTPTLSSVWIHLITPVPSAIAMPLAEGLKNKVVCRDNRIRNIIPQYLLSCREAISLSLNKVKEDKVETCWSDAGCLIPPEWTYCGDADYTGGTVLNCGYRIALNASAEEIWKPLVQIGGRRGWYYGDVLWNIRGILDRIIGGYGTQRSRRSSAELYVGDALDFWRVSEIDPNRRLLLQAEMKSPGESLLQFQIRPLGRGVSELELLARFLPKGLGGLVYWYAMYPFHEIMFSGMLKSIAKTVDKPIVSGPERFTPKLPDECRITR